MVLLSIKITSNRTVTWDQKKIFKNQLYRSCVKREYGYNTSSDRDSPIHLISELSKVRNNPMGLVAN